MKLFLDSADLAEIREVAGWGMLDGVTSNPTYAAKAKMPPAELYPEICRLVKGPVSLETVGLSTDDMVQQGRALASVADNVVVKVPMTREGMVAVQRLKAEGIKCNVTLAFSAIQALLAAKAGAYFVSPFIGRLDNIGHIGMDVIRQTRQIFDNYDFDTQILTASVHSPAVVLEAALAGSDICTIPFDVFQKLYDHPLTDIGIKRFLDDWEKVPQKDEIWHVAAQR